MFELFLLILAIENLTDILVNLELLEKPRAWLESKLGPFGKIVRCRYCQMFWLILIAILFTAPYWMVAVFALHRLTFLFSEFTERYINAAPWNVFVQKKTTVSQESDS